MIMQGDYRENQSYAQEYIETFNKLGLNAFIDISTCM